MQKTREIVSFELRYQLRQPAFWIASVAFAAFGVLAMSSGVGDLEGLAGRVARNAPMAVVHHLTVISAFGMFAVTVFVAGAALRDFATNTHPLVFSRPIRPRHYLLGRFLGGLGVSLFSMGLGAAAMLAASFALEGRSPHLGPTALAPYVYGCALLVLPNTLLVAATVFVLAVWTRKLGATFVGLMVFVVGQDVAEALPRSRFGDTLPALLDPLGLAALDSLQRYWSVADYARPLEGLDGLLLVNRLAWLAVAAGLFALGLRTFDYAKSASGRLFGRGAASPREVEPEEPRFAPSGAGAAARPPARRGPRADLTRTLHIARFELLRILRNPAFGLIGASTVALVIFGATQREALLAIGSFPITRLMLEAIRRASAVPVTVLILLLAGQVVWRERVSRMSDTFDALPVPLWSVVLGKLTALGVWLAGLFVVLALTAVAFQRAQGFEVIEPGLYVAGTALRLLPFLSLAVMAVFLQVLAGSRMLGFLLIGVFLVTRLLLRAAGVSDPLVDYGGERVPAYSDMDGWGQRLEPFLWSQAWWFAIGALLLVLAGLLWPRGLATGLRERARMGRSRFTRATGLALGLCLLALLVSGGKLVRETSGARAVPSGRARAALDADYETRYRHLVDTPLPRVRSMRAEVDFWPARRAVEIRGHYALLHEGAGALESVALNLDPDLRVRALELSGARRTHSDARQGMFEFELDPALESGASAVLEFDLVLKNSGFGRRRSERWIRGNGMTVVVGTGRHEFFRGAQLFPAFGYDVTRELRGEAEREKHGLGPWNGLPGPQAAPAETVDWADFELVLSTSADQSVVAPGNLVETHEQGGRRFSSFASGHAVPTFFPIVTGRYELRQVEAGDTTVELYHHAAHPWNVERMLAATAASLEHLGAELGPYPERVLRIAEIPGYGQFAASFRGIMPFSERMGFLELEPATGEVDALLWVVAHETAHQWWDGEVQAATAQGSTFVSETLAQYGALRVMQAEAGPEMVRAATALFRENYLRARGRGGREERALLTVEEQDFVHYQKGWLVMRNVERTLGPAAVASGLREIVTRHGGADGRAVTSRDVLEALKAHAGDVDTAFMDDLFERIVLLEMGLESARARPSPAGGFEVTLEVSAVKWVADGEGHETPAAVADRFEVALYGGPDGDRRLALAGGPIEGPSASLVMRVDERPTRAVLDPEFLHIDRNLLDNEREIEFED